MTTQQLLDTLSAVGVSRCNGLTGKWVDLERVEARQAIEQALHSQSALVAAVQALMRAGHAGTSDDEVEAAYKTGIAALAQAAGGEK